jgi:hypothetical protein
MSARTKQQLTRSVRIINEEGAMRRTNTQSEYVVQEDGTELCPECGHLWSDYGVGHYHDCRYFILEDGMEEEFYGHDDLLRMAQLSLFRPAA